MDGRDLGRALAPAMRHAAQRAGLAALWRRQRPPAAATATECLKAGSGPAPLFEPLRRGQGAAQPASPRR